MTDVPPLYTLGGYVQIHNLQGLRASHLAAQRSGAGETPPTSQPSALTLPCAQVLGPSPPVAWNNVAGLAEQFRDARAPGRPPHEGNVERWQATAGFDPRDRLAGDARSVGQSSLRQTTTTPGQPGAVVYPAGRANPDFHPIWMPTGPRETDASLRFEEIQSKADILPRTTTRLIFDATSMAPGPDLGVQAPIYVCSRC